MREVDLDQPGELAEYIRSKFEARVAPTTDFQKFRYERPTLKSGKNRAAVRLALTDLLFAVVQVIETGGESVMHSHAAMDGLWFVLKGRARFYDGANESHEFGPMEGLCIPHGVKYWFEKVGEETLEILQCDARDPSKRNSVEFENVTPDSLKAAHKKISIFDAVEASPHS
jgi:mannose-6-phosphate isomerase-like protein (cupin superfamily)